MQTNKHISRQALERFIIETGLEGVVGFLEYSKDLGNLRTFARCMECEEEIGNVATVLFHGTREAHTVLSPASADDTGEARSGEAYVYATDEPNYAIFLACIHLKNGTASVSISPEETKLTIDCDFVNHGSQLREGYVHIVAGDSFTGTDNREFRSNEPVDVLFSIPVSPADLTVPIYVETEPRTS